MVIPPKYAVSITVEAIKQNTSRALSRKFNFLKRSTGTRRAFGGKAILSQQWESTKK
jgi:REP element-mobilizing transposase RayT